MNAEHRQNLRQAGARRARAENERGEAHIALAAAVRAAADADCSPSEIAQEAGVSRQTIHNILRSA